MKQESQVHQQTKQNDNLKAKVIILMGYPASGKSTFSKSLAKSNDSIVLANFDDMRDRSKMEELISTTAKSQSKILIIDNCNLKKAERDNCFNLAFQPENCWLICFTTDIDTCKYRITRRKDNPTIPEGDAGLKILSSLAGKLQMPDEKEEKRYSRVIYIQTEEESNELMASLGVVNLPQFQESNNFVQFPRTKHFMNLGAASKDDKVLQAGERLEFLGRQVCIEEKIDGANMGIRLTFNEEAYRVQDIFTVQGRNHVVTAEPKTQFEKLDGWLETHQEDLEQILNPNDNPNDKFTIFGEWMYAKHSIKYNKIPDYFIAYDIYDEKLKKFDSRTVFNKKLQGTSIQSIPVIFQGIVQNEQDFCQFLGKSQFYDGEAQGIYIRTFDQADLHLDGRCQIVRKDFKGGNENWGKGIQKNELIQK